MNQIAIDKQAHFFSGWAIAATLYTPLGWTAAVIAIGAGALKEYRDSKGYGTPDRLDFVATAVGGILGAATCAILASWFA